MPTSNFQPIRLLDQDYCNKLHILKDRQCRSRSVVFFRSFVFGFNNTSTLVGHFVLSPREREKRDTRDSRRDEREEQGRKRNRNEREETEEIKTFPLYLYLLQGQQALPNCKPISVGRSGDTRYRRLMLWMLVKIFQMTFWIMYYFFQKIGFDISCKLAPEKTTYMPCWSLLSGEK